MKSMLVKLLVNLIALTGSLLFSLSSNALNCEELVGKFKCGSGDIFSNYLRYDAGVQYWKTEVMYETRGEIKADGLARPFFDLPDFKDSTLSLECKRGIIKDYNGIWTEADILQSKRYGKYVSHYYDNNEGYESLAIVSGLLIRNTWGYNVYRSGVRVGVSLTTGYCARQTE